MTSFYFSEKGLCALVKVATAIEKLNSRALLGHFPGLFKQGLRPGARNILAPPVNKNYRV